MKYQMKDRYGSEIFITSEGLAREEIEVYASRQRCYDHEKGRWVDSSVSIVLDDASDEGWSIYFRPEEIDSLIVALARAKAVALNLDLSPNSDQTEIEIPDEA